VRFAVVTLVAGLLLVAVIVLSDPLGILILPWIAMLVLVLAVAVYAVAKAIDEDG
jgi:hypothetical protein